MNFEDTVSAWFRHIVQVALWNDSLQQNMMLRRRILKYAPTNVAIPADRWSRMWFRHSFKTFLVKGSVVWSLFCEQSGHFLNSVFMWQLLSYRKFMAHTVPICFRDVFENGACHGNFEQAYMFHACLFCILARVRARLCRCVGFWRFWYLKIAFAFVCG